MAVRVLSKSNRKTVAEYKAELAYIFDEMDKSEERGKVFRAESERISAETKILEASIDIKLQQLHQQIAQLTESR